MTRLPAGEPDQTIIQEPAASLEALAAATDPAAVAEVAARHPTCLAAWATLGDLALRDGRPVEAYAYFRVGCHRGLDRLRQAGWRGSGRVPWSSEGKATAASSAPSPAWPKPPPSSPKPTRPPSAASSSLDGRCVVDLDAASLALLTWVEGEPLTGSGADEHQVIGETLALAHQALQGASVPAAQHFHWVRPDADHLALRPWIRPAVTDAVAALDRLDAASRTWGLLHSDPAPEHFRLDPSSGRCGVIDWSVALEGPLRYDLASAVMYVGARTTPAP